MKYPRRANQGREHFFVLPTYNQKLALYEVPGPNMRLLGTSVSKRLAWQ